jgi:cell division septal protein FtsQ
VRGVDTGSRDKSWVGSLLLLGLALLFIGRFLGDARFRVAQVSVVGASLAPVEEIEAHADALGRPIFMLNTRQAEARILDALGCLSRARVQTRLPDRVYIQVSEKDALLLWENQGRYWWVDAEGRVLGVARSRGELPAVHDRRALETEPDQYIVGIPWAFAAEMSRALPDARDFEFTLEDGLILITAEGWPVYLGMGGNAAQKALLLQELTETLAARGSRVVFIDLKNEQRPAVKIEIG